MRATAVRALIALGSLLAASGCASRRGAPEPHYAREVLTTAELEASSSSNLYDAMRSLRPTWLAGRGAPSIRSPSPQPIVYVDGMRMGGIEWLSTIPTLSVAEARLLNAADATTRWGTGHATGVILVVTRR